ncbi:hypothetical protein VTJ83DRAFT_1634 [Remersonia thermophila]|uniref:tRNA(Phe) 7-[(3-amino-3-carboxypropyl)-4-demethylwyosine(37)-N(4)]-methyltransferase n=1 Tax=Remersonia thermophila TaxID=72144 RepID=A0ABR4DGG9_9PEZI
MGKPHPLPTPGRAFTLKKQKILADLARPEGEYVDASPKGSVDAGLRELIDRLNAREGLVTTSSCAGRVSVYLEGPRGGSGGGGGGEGGEGGGRGASVATASAEEREKSGPATTASAAGGKGGGEWLFVSHDPVGEVVEGLEGYERLLLGRWEPRPGGGGREETVGYPALNDSSRLIHFKFEPMILHVLTASVEHAQLVIQAGMEAGFRETGAVSLTGRQSHDEATPMVAVRSMGLSLESLIAAETDGARRLLVPPQHLQTLVQIANERFAENQKRIARFDAALEAAFKAAEKRRDREDSLERRERKRQEGLRRREQLELERARAATDRELREDLAEEAIIDFVLHEQRVV